MPRVSVNHLCKYYGHVRALDSISFEAQASSVIAVRGENGAGKTTLLNCIASVLRPDSGTINIDCAGAGYLGHKSFLYDDISVRANLVFWARLAGVNDYHSRVEALLEASSLIDHAEKKIRALSAGMVKKLSLCRALLNDPEMLILDEPFSALDEPAMRFVFDVIRRLRDRGGIVLFTTHQSDISSTLSTHTLVLEQGKLVRFEPAAAGGTKC